MQLPDNLVANEFGEVNVEDHGGKREVRFTILSEPQGDDAIDWQTGVALDGSTSMRASYGHVCTVKNLSEHERKKLERTGVLTWKMVGPKRVPQIKDKRWLEELMSYRAIKNIVEAPAREFVRYLAALDADQHTTAIYWSCGSPDARSDQTIQLIGDFEENECSTIKIQGPQHFGSRTLLLPAVRYFADRFADAEHGMYIFITDGKWRDQDEVLKFTRDLARKIAAKKRNPIKCVIIGLGSDIDEKQMIELDDLEAEVDIWDHKLAAEARDLPRLVRKIWAEPERPDMKVASAGVVKDSAGRILATYPNDRIRWLPAEVKFTMSKNTDFFTLDVEEYDLHIEQTVVVR